jgi:hypothetical protein
MTLINCQGIAFEPYQIKRDLTEKNIKNYLLLLFEERAFKRDEKAFFFILWYIHASVNGMITG